MAEDGTRTALAVLQAFVPNQGDAWTLMLEGLRCDFDTVVLAPESEAPDPTEAFAPHLRWAELLGRRTAELHVARMLARGEASEVEPGRFQATS